MSANEMPERHADTERNKIINRASSDLEQIINGHDPEIHHLGNRVWDRLDKMAVDIENHRSDLCASGQQVRALEWTESTETALDCDWVDSFGLYQISEAVLFIGHTPSGVEFDTVEAAKAAAQTDYERRILAAMEKEQGE